MFKRRESIITKEDILDKTSVHTIFSFYLPRFTYGRAFISPFRKEKRPSFIVRMHNDGGVTYKDYGDDRFSGDCFSLVMQLYGLSFKDALKKIDKDLELGLGNDLIKTNSAPIIHVSEPIITQPKDIKVLPREFTTADLNFWKEYLITKEELVAEKIYSVDKWWVDGEQKKKSKYEVGFCYMFDEGKKIYFPYRKDWKWYSSVPNNVIEGWDNIDPNHSILIITKSRKDRIVLSKSLKNVINAQNESISLLTEENRKKFKCFKEVWVFFDSDDPGVKACKKLTEEMGWRYINTPRYLLSEGVNDPAGWVKRDGNYENLNKFLISKGLKLNLEV